MKKLISVALAVVILLSVAIIAFPTSAAGVYINQNFESMEKFTSQFIAGAWYTENDGGILYGYAEARALQTQHETDDNGCFVDNGYTWRTYDTSVTLAVADDDLSESDRYINLVYCNDNTVYYGRTEDRIMMSFMYDIQERCFRLAKGWNNTDPADQLMDPVYKEINTDGEEFFTLGMSVDRGQIYCYYNDDLIFSYTDYNNDYLIAEKITSPFLLWQDGNFIQISNITVASQGYLYRDIGYADVSTDFVTEPAEPDVTDPITTEPPMTEPTEPEISVSEGFSLVPVPSASDRDTFVYDLVYNGYGAEIAAVALDLDYSDNLELVSCDCQYNDGSFVTANNIDEKPFAMVWAGGTFALPYDEMTTLATLTFNVVGALDFGITLSLEYMPNNAPINISGADVSDVVPVSGEVEYSYIDLKKLFPEIPPISDEAPVIAADGFYLKPVSGNRGTIVYDLCYMAPEPYAVTMVGLRLNYSDNLALSECDYNYTKGTFCASPTVDVKPYIMLWAWGTGSLPCNEEVTIARLTFDVVGSLDNGIYLDLYYDENNRPTDMDGTVYDDAAVPASGLVRYNLFQLADQFPEIHDMVSYPDKAPTCTESGWVNYAVCAVCGYTTFQELSPVGHDVYECEAKAPTCTEDGWDAYEACANCDYSTKVVIPATGHICVSVAGQEPTCTEAGWMPYDECTVCDYDNYTVIPALGHDLISHDKKTPTCSEVGWRAYEECTRCDYTTYSELPTIAHNTIKYEGKEPTCIEGGWSAYEMCMDCDYTTYKELPATGEHTGGNATCAAKAVCDVCGQEYGEVSDTHGETEIRDAVEATADADGYTGDTYCKDCGAKIAEGETIPKLRTPGDVTGEGKINLADVSLILKYIAKWDVELNTSAADVTADGKVNLADVSLLLKYIAKWDVTLK